MLFVYCGSGGRKENRNTSNRDPPVSRGNKFSSMTLAIGCCDIATLLRLAWRKPHRLGAGGDNAHVLLMHPKKPPVIGALSAGLSKLQVFSKSLRWSVAFVGA